jgi:putative hydrolase of the HAD superfamily
MSSKASGNLPQTLLIDADDTLWENNIYFERAIANFISFLNHQEYSPEQVREKLDAVEIESIQQHGYGLNGFANSLVQTFEQLSVEAITPALHETILGFAHAIAEQPIEILAGVPETLEYLSRRHRLILVTKGAFSEQAGKLERSGLKRFFSAVEVVPEKDRERYLEVVGKHDLPHRHTWMIGNSPKSDINPAMKAGLNAVFVPHGNTWIFEHDELDRPPANCQLLVVEKFSELREHF